MSDDFLSTFIVGDEIQLEIIIDNEKQVLKSQVLECTSAHKIIISCPIFKSRFISLNIGERYRMFHYDSESGIYQFVGLVVQRDKVDQIIRLHILRVSDVKRSQRREYFRLSLIEDALILQQDGEIEEVFIHQGHKITQSVPKMIETPALVKDISAGGMRVHSRQPIPIDSQIKIKFELESEKYTLEGQIVRCFAVEDVVERYDLGIKFINVEPQLQRKLVAVIFDKQRRLLKKGMV